MKTITKNSADRKKVHIARKQLMMDDDVYRDILRVNFNGAESSTDLSDSEIKRLITIFQAKGFKPLFGRKKQDMQAPKDAMSKKIKALWITLFEMREVRNSSETALNAYCRRMTGIDRRHWLDNKQKAVVIESLKSWVERAERRTS